VTLARTEGAAERRHTNTMTIQTLRAATRTRLAPRYAAQAPTNHRHDRPRRSPTLSTLELRRLVADMVD
jgi:hypothetical protein